MGKFKLASNQYFRRTQRKLRKTSVTCDLRAEKNPQGGQTKESDEQRSGDGNFTVILRTTRHLFPQLHIYYTYLVTHT